MTTDYAVKGTDLQFTSSTTTFTSVGQVKSLDGPGVTMGERDATHLMSSLKEPRPTIGDPNEISGTLVYSNKDDVQRVAAGRCTTPSTIFQTASPSVAGFDEFKIILPTTTLFWRFHGYWKSFVPQGGDENGTWMANFTIRVATTIILPTS